MHIISTIFGAAAAATAVSTLALSNAFPTTAFIRKSRTTPLTSLEMSSFAADGSEYSSKDTDFDDEEIMSSSEYKVFNEDTAESPVIELGPVPMSKNAGNRFIALMWDQELDTKGRDPTTLHEDRDELVEDHVMFCRKRNLYNETFNTESMVDIMRSLPM